jgi:hypothetical protein
MVVEIALGGIGGEGRGQDGVDQLFGGGLAVAAGDGDKGDVELPAVVEGQLLEAGQDVGDEDEMVAGALQGRFVDDGVGGAELEGAGAKALPLKLGPLRAKKRSPVATGACPSGSKGDGDRYRKLFDGHLLGTPKFRRMERVHPAFDRTTFFYKRSYFKGKAIFQFNFLNEIFISCVVTFVQQRNSGERLFLKMINEKYLLSQDKLLNPLEGIIDQEGNLLLYEENVYSSLVYVNAATVHKNIEKEVDEKLKLVNLLLWKKHYQNWSDNL